MRQVVRQGIHALQPCQAPACYTTAWSSPWAHARPLRSRTRPCRASYCSGGSDLRVLFMHGLESGTTGDKAMYLREHFRTVAVPDMQVSKYRLDRRNSLPRCYARAVCSFKAWPSQWLAAAITDSLSDCLQRQSVAIEDFKPDVVVASSWGAGIGLLAFTTEVWRGPMLLLAPALQHVIRKSAPPVVPELQWRQVVAAVKASEARRRLLVVHGDEDATVPVEDSLELGRQTGVDVRVVAGGDHKLNAALLRTNALAALVEEVAQRT